MIVSTKGIIIRTLNYRETSKIVEVFTESDGLVALIAKGVRKQPKLLGIFEPMNIVYVSFYKKKTQELHLLSKAETISSFQKLLQSQNKMFVGLTILSLIKETQVPENPNKYLFDLTINCLENLKRNSSNPFVVLVYFIIRLTQNLGIDITEKLAQWKGKNYSFLSFDISNGELHADVKNTKFPIISRNTVELVMAVDEFEIETLDKIHIISMKINEILLFIEQYLSFYLDKLIKIKTIDIFHYDI